MASLDNKAHIKLAIARANKIINNLPYWKRNILIQSGKPTSAKRQIVINDQ